MRIIFLDVDGVLNNDDTTDKYRFFTGIDPILVDRLKKIYDESNKEDETRIVISSSWRVDKIRKTEYSDGSYEYLVQRLEEKGMEIIGNTPEDWYTSLYRGREIYAWLILNMDKYDIDHFVILDDENFDICNYEDWRSRFVCTDYHLGLTENDVNKALKILSGPKYRLTWTKM
jgi:hypothetical protein